MIPTETERAGAKPPTGHVKQDRGPVHAGFSGFNHHADLRGKGGMRLKELVEVIDAVDFKGDPDLNISSIAYDSRAVGPKTLFVALKGHRQDGHRFIGEALSKGAVAVISELSPDSPHLPRQGGAALVQVPDSREALSRVAVRFFNAPFKEMSMVGVTGTNGKTTTAYILESILLGAGHRPGVIGTVSYRYPGHVQDAPVTTPESLDLMKVLREMANTGVTHAVMEVSSHALDQGRVRACPFGVAIFTNISRDHLDYHGSMESYFRAKAILFTSLGAQGTGETVTAVINIDDPKGQELMRLTPARVMTYGMGEGCDVRAEQVRVSWEGLSARLITPEGEAEVESALMGEFDIYNIMAAAAGALSLGIHMDSIRSGVKRLKGVPGRLERVRNNRGLAIVVDYAHTPDALLKALRAVRALTNGRVLTVIGCGGDRDRGKRRPMGRVAGMESDMVFITSDNPRTEDPDLIAAQIEEGVIESGLRDYTLDLDRERAIQRAVEAARNDDLILIAGKGHETYQIIGTQKKAFDDRVVAARAAR